MSTIYSSITVRKFNIKQVSAGYIYILTRRWWCLLLTSVAFKILKSKKWLNFKIVTTMKKNSPSFPLSTARKPPWAITRTKCWAVIHNKSCCSNASKVWILQLLASHGSMIPAELGRNSPPANNCITLLYAIWMGKVCLLFNSERCACYRKFSRQHLLYSMNVKNY